MATGGVPIRNITVSEDAVERHRAAEEAWAAGLPGDVYQVAVGGSDTVPVLDWARDGEWAFITVLPVTETDPRLRELGAVVYIVPEIPRTAGRNRQAEREIIRMIAVPVKDREADPRIDERFGRCPYFCLIDGEGKRTFLDNEAPTSPSGAGVKAVQTLADEDVTVVLSPEVGPKAMAAMEPLGIKVFHIGEARTVSEVLSLYEENKLEERRTPSSGGGLRRA